MGRRFGQHFLHDRRVLDDILGAASLRPGQRVLEIGPGRGALTAPLAEAVGPSGRVVAVEADPDMAQPLFGRWPNVDVVLRDVMKTDLARLGPFDAIVANLPYQISGPVTAMLLDLLESQGWRLAVLMYQKEFGDRLVAGPGSKAYGKLSVQAQRLCRVERVRTVAPGCFDPPPKVDGVVLAFKPLERPVFAADTSRLRAVLDAAFGQRRKQLHNSLASLVPPDTLERLGASHLRPEQVPVDQWGPIIAAARVE